jgi:hypothetical protein
MRIQRRVIIMKSMVLVNGAVRTVRSVMLQYVSIYVRQYVIISSKLTSVRIGAVILQYVLY